MNQTEQAARQTIDRFRPAIADPLASEVAKVSDTSLAPKPVRWQADGELSESDELASPAESPIMQNAGNDESPSHPASDFKAESQDVK